MKYVIAIVKAFRAEEVLRELEGLEVEGLTVSEVRGYGRQRGHSEMYQEAEYTNVFLPKARIEFSVSDDLLEEAIQHICSAARTGRIGDGKIFVLSSREALWGGGN